MNPRRLGVGLLLAACLGLVWLAWRPLPPSAPTTAHRAVPGQDDELWRVVTRKRVWRQGAEELQRRLEAAGLVATILERRETVGMHAFDDVHSYPTRAEAEAAMLRWRGQGFEASLQETDHGFGVSLGRFYLPEHAEHLHQRLRQTGMPFHYEQRQVVIPVYRLALPAAEQQEAEALWRRVQALGIADPMLMTEEQFQSVFAQPAAPD